MTICSILVPVLPDIAFDNQLAAAADLARRLDARINAVFVLPDPLMVLAGIPIGAMAPGVASTMIAQNADAQAQAAPAKAKFERWRKEELAANVVDRSLRTPYAQWSQRVGDIAPTVARCSRLNDLVILNMPNGSIATGVAFDAAVFESGRPTLLVGKTIYPDLLRHVVIAWNGSREAARAVGASMALLRAAEQVSIFTTLDEAAIANDLDLAESLNWHGINPPYLRPQPGGTSAEDALMHVIATANPSMVLMGAYTHSRLREAVLGGMTRHVLEHANVPLLMMH
jgi:nucleotide-binding universal stress UspA family protein